MNKKQRSKLSKMDTGNPWGACSIFVPYHARCIVKAARNASIRYESVCGQTWDREKFWDTFNPLAQAKGLKCHERYNPLWECYDMYFYKAPH